MEDFNVGDTVRVVRINISGFTSFIGSEGTIEAQDPYDRDGFNNTVRIKDGPVLYLSDNELERISS
jgi:hypothetical protein